MAPLPTRPSIPDSLENASHALDALIRDARLSHPQTSRRRHDMVLAELEERAQAIAASIVAPFRGAAAPSAPPLSFETHGGSAQAWY
ncbi:MAG: hypothetical protein JHD35_16195 [Sphingopyxis sp.]|nr:hypothetical protein [Sphingopyxis sp.]